MGTLRYQSDAVCNRGIGALEVIVETIDQHVDQQEYLLRDMKFIWEKLPEVDQGNGLREQAVRAIVRAIMREMYVNPALAHRYRVLAREATKLEVTK